MNQGAFAWEPSESSGHSKALLVRRSRRLSGIKSTSKQAIKSKQNVVKEVPKKTLTSVPIAIKRVRWKDEASLSENCHSYSPEIIRGSRENKKRWTRLTGILRSSKRFILTKNARDLLLQSCEAFQKGGLDCSFRSLKGTDVCKTSGVCSHTLAEMFKYMGDTIDGSYGGLETTGGLFKPFDDGAVAAPKILMKTSRYSKRQDTKRRGNPRRARKEL